MNKKLLLIPLTIIASVALFGPMASANTMQVTLDYGSRHYGDGGEFNASSSDFAPAAMGYAAQTIYNAGHGTGFETFCVETNEFFNPGSTYYYQVSQAAVLGGVGGGSPDPISQGTAWLYLQFATHTLSNYDYSTMGENTSARDLQLAIWWLEGEITNPNNFYSTLVTTQFGGATNAMADNATTGQFGVGVLNLWVNSDDTGPAQDQLILTGSLNQLTSVPDGGSTAMLLGLGFLGLFVGRCKLNRRSHAA